MVDHCPGKNLHGRHRFAGAGWRTGRICHLLQDTSAARCTCWTDGRNCCVSHHPSGILQDFRRQARLPHGSTPAPLRAQGLGRSYGSGALLADRKSTRLNSSHVSISYAVFCLKKKTFQTLFPTHSTYQTTIIHLQFFQNILWLYRGICGSLHITSLRVPNRLPLHSHNNHTVLKLSHFLTIDLSSLTTSYIPYNYQRETIPSFHIRTLPYTSEAFPFRAIPIQTILFFLFLSIRHPPISTLFPYTTLFR